MAPSALTGLILGLTALSACSPIVARQESDAEAAAEDIIADIPGLPVLPLPIKDLIDQAADASSRDVDKWCKSSEITDPEEAVKIWEDYKVGQYLDKFVADMPNGGDGWFSNLTESSLEAMNVGDTGTGGEIGSLKCQPAIQCNEAVEEYAIPEAYYVLKAVQGFHSKLNSAHTYLQDTVIETMLSFGEIVEDFSAPDEDQTLVTIAGLLTSCLFVVGGVAGVASAGLGYAAASATAAIGVAESQNRQAKQGHGPEGYEAQTKKLLDDAHKRADGFTSNQRTAGTMGASIYLLGSTFSTINAANSAEGQVSRNDLESALKQLFTDARERLKAMGRLALGRDAGADYSALPSQEGVAGGLGENPYIAGFFSDGKFLLSESHKSWDEQLSATFGQYKTKIVEQALQSAGYQIFSPTWIDNGDDCGSDRWAGYGSQFVDMGDGNSYCMMLYKPNVSGRCSTLTQCEWETADSDTINLLQNKYGWRFDEWYKAAYHCAKSGNGEPDTMSLPEDGTQPLCFWNTPAKKVTIGNSCSNPRCTTQSKIFDFDDFE